MMTKYYRIRSREDLDTVQAWARDPDRHSRVFHSSPEELWLLIVDTPPGCEPVHPQAESDLRDRISPFTPSE